MVTDKHPWLEKYPENVPQTIDPEVHQSLLELFETCFSKYKDRVAFYNMGKSLTFGEIDELSKKFASFIQNETSLKKGDRLAIQSPNLLQYPVTLFGALRAGLIVVNTNPLYTKNEMLHQFKDAQVKGIVILTNFADKLEGILTRTPIQTIITTNIGDMMPGWKRPVINFMVKHVKRMVPQYYLPHAIDFTDIMKDGQAETWEKPDLKGDDIAFLQYTGGTTGVPKGAILTHRNMVAQAEQIAAWMKATLEEGKETIVTALPLYHIFALSVNALSMMTIGASNLLITNPRDMKGFIKELKKHKFSIITGVNTLFNSLMNTKGFDKIDFSNLKIAVAGGMALQNAVAEKWRKMTNSPMAEGYGLTETAPVLSCNPIDGTEKMGTIGLPVPNTEMTILDDDGNEVPQGQPGEICAKGPQIMPEYWHQPEETQKVFINGWFKTGDIGIMNEDGFFRIVDRKKEMINVSGFNVYPNEIENVVAAHPKVMEVGCIGIPDNKSNEIVKIFVVSKDESLTKDEILKHCKENLTSYKLPKEIEFRTELPKSNVGKILRRVLKEEDEKKNEASQDSS